MSQSLAATSLRTKNVLFIGFIFFQDKELSELRTLIQQLKESPELKGKFFIGWLAVKKLKIDLI